MITSTPVKELTGKQHKNLCIAVLALPKHRRLMLFRWKFNIKWSELPEEQGIRPSDLPMEQGEELRAFLLVSKAEEEGWVSELMSELQKEIRVSSADLPNTALQMPGYEGSADRVEDRRAMPPRERSAETPPPLARLTFKQREGLWEILLGAFDRASMERMLSFKLDMDLKDIVEPGSFDAEVFQVIQRAEMEGWICRLLVAAHEFRPDNGDLAAFLQAAGVS